MSDVSTEVTQLLRAMREGTARPDASDRLFQLLYDDLRARAARHMRREHRADHTLEPTALVNEAYLRLGPGVEHIGLQGRLHFLRIASRVMQRVLRDHARRINAAKRGGEREHGTLVESHIGEVESAYSLVELSEALDQLQERDPRGAEVTRLKLFAGLSNEEIATELEVSRSSVDREWAHARHWLSAALFDS